MENNVALVFGASGISGWALTKNLLSYPTATTFSRIIGLTNRVMDVENSQLPIEDLRLEFYSGINLRGDLLSVIDQLRATVPRLEEVTHMYYCAYSNVTAYSENVMGIRELNVHMTGNAVQATDQLCKNLKFLVLQTGTNCNLVGNGSVPTRLADRVSPSQNYGVAVFGHQDKIDVNPPLKESQPRIPSPYGDEIFYYGQVDAVKEAQKGKSWNWCEVRPDAIVGFTPGETTMSFLEPVGLFLSLWRYINGPGAEIPFIGTEPNYRHTNTDSSHDIIARSEIYLSVVKSTEASGEAFNIADYATPVSWVERWPTMVSYFGLKGVPPKEPHAETMFAADKWWQEHQDDYKRMCSEYGLRERVISPEAWVFMRLGFEYLCRDRALSLDKIRSVGFTEEFSMCEGHYIGFDRMAAAKILPSRNALQMDA